MTDRKELPIAEPDFITQHLAIGDADIDRSSQHDESTALPDPRAMNQSANRIHGWRLVTINIGLSIGIFLASVDISIVATALVAISNSLKSFEQGSWIVNSYMLTFTGFLIIIAKLSEIFGHKLFLTTSFVIFIVFSGACGAAQTTTQLIIFRAFQGIGGSGMYSLAYVLFFQIAPPAKYALYTALITSMVSIGVLCGVLLGGAISSSGQWRWIFLMNVPVGFIGALSVVVALPSNLSGRSATIPITEKKGSRGFPSTHSLRKVDFIGCLLLLGALILLVTALEEAADGRSWRSSVIISTLVISGALWLVFLAWERYLTNAIATQEPVFPWRLARSRTCVGLILSMLLVGGQYTACMIQIPQRYQTMNGLSPFQAAIRLFPFSLTSPFIGTLAAGVAKKRKVPPMYLCLTGSIIQVVGMALLSSAPKSSQIFGGLYGYQVVAGFGVGINLILLTLMVPFVAEERDRATATGMALQARNLGGSVCLAIVASVFNGYIRSHLRQITTSQELTAILQSSQAVKELPRETQMKIVHIFGEGYRLEFLILIGFAAAQIPANLLMWKKEQIRVEG